VVFGGTVHTHTANRSVPVPTLRVSRPSVRMPSGSVYALCGPPVK
jgi:hypothetical protein